MKKSKSSKSENGAGKKQEQGSFPIIVIGASAGGFEALKKIVAGLPKDLPASIFIVWHMSAEVRGFLPEVLNRENTIQVAHACDGETIAPNRIRVAPPDRHLLIEDGQARVTRGPKENRFRPAVDPLFRSAAYAYNNRVIGVILSGGLDDGTAGLWAIKQRGGTAVVQDPRDAEVPSMPENALREVEVDYSVPVSEMADLLARLSKEKAGETSEVIMEDDEKTKIEIGIAAEDGAFESGIMQFGELSPFTCPDCHGVLSKIKDGKRSRFRCHTGHAFSADALLATVTENIEDSLYNAMRGVEESIMLLNHIGDHFAEVNQTKLAAMYFKKANEAQNRAQIVRQVVLTHEQLSTDILRQQAGEANGGNGQNSTEAQKH
ncbi:MAG: Protein-glutamate methylesterase [uncultured Pyrinomonadaceae bacterium]|uniref:protein-glutamate methylesterase n=1 Tax=uncultured Pyrinomonadaceae bacterium TaxID=2283094 RepID=A0A6J4NMC8_9BACT|nr:MAG: Protein-glutamate methylesterase [uncultured Pyrinomonadaceae bacterium]